ncbi:MAG: hypothetical protein WCS42_10185 [Verrucomicrobiota bacterium]
MPARKDLPVQPGILILANIDEFLFCMIFLDEGFSAKRARGEKVFVCSFYRDSHDSSARPIVPGGKFVSTAGNSLASPHLLFSAVFFDRRVYAVSDPGQPR